MDENQLIIKAQNGDNEAFRELVETHQSKVYHLLLGFLRDEYAAEEVAVETFVKAWRHLSSFRLEATFWTWLYGIAYRSAIDYKRRQDPEKNLCLLEENLVSEKAGPLDLIIEKDRNKDLLKALQKISFQQRAAIILYYFQGLSYQEIADITKRPIGTIRADLHRGKKRLKEILTGKWREDGESKRRQTPLGRREQITEGVRSIFS